MKPQRYTADGSNTSKVEIKVNLRNQQGRRFNQTKTVDYTQLPSIEGYLRSVLSRYVYDGTIKPMTREVTEALQRSFESTIVALNEYYAERIKHKLLPWMIKNSAKHGGIYTGSLVSSLVADVNKEMNQLQMQGSVDSTTPQQWKARLAVVVKPQERVEHSALLKGHDAPGGGESTGRYISPYLQMYHASLLENNPEIKDDVEAWLKKWAKAAMQGATHGSAVGRDKNGLFHDVIPVRAELYNEIRRLKAELAKKIEEAARNRQLAEAREASQKKKDDKKSPVESAVQQAEEVKNAIPPATQPKNPPSAPNQEPQPTEDKREVPPSVKATQGDAKRAEDFEKRAREARRSTNQAPAGTPPYYRTATEMQEDFARKLPSTNPDLYGKDPELAGLQSLIGTALIAGSMDADRPFAEQARRMGWGPDTLINMGNRTTGELLDALNKKRMDPDSYNQMVTLDVVNRMAQSPDPNVAARGRALVDSHSKAEDALRSGMDPNRVWYETGWAWSPSLQDLGTELDPGKTDENKIRDFTKLAKDLANTPAHTMKAARLQQIIGQPIPMSVYPSYDEVINLPVKLRDIYTNPEMEAVFPELMGIPVSFIYDPNATYGGFMGEVSSKQKPKKTTLYMTLNLGNPHTTPQHLLSSLIPGRTAFGPAGVAGIATSADSSQLNTTNHEGSHAIQSTQGYPNGINPEWLASQFKLPDNNTRGIDALGHVLMNVLNEAGYIYRFLLEKKPHLRDLFKALKFKEAVQGADYVDRHLPSDLEPHEKEAYRRWSKLADIAHNLMNDIQSGKKFLISPHEAYHNTLGEWAARIRGMRSFLPDVIRKITSPPNSMFGDTEEPMRTYAKKLGLGPLDSLYHREQMDPNGPGGIKQDALKQAFQRSGIPGGITGSSKLPKTIPEVDLDAEHGYGVKGIPTADNKSLVVTNNNVDPPVLDITTGTGQTFRGSHNPYISRPQKAKDYVSQDPAQPVKNLADDMQNASIPAPDKVNEVLPKIEKAWRDRAKTKNTSTDNLTPEELKEVADGVVDSEVQNGNIDPAPGAGKQLLDFLKGLRYKIHRPHTTEVTYEIPNADPDSLLNLDKPLKEQSDKVRQKLGKLAGKDTIDPNLTGRQIFDGLKKTSPSPDDPVASSDHAVRQLLDKGIPGVTYLERNPKTGRPRRAVTLWDVPQTPASSKRTSSLPALTPQTVPEYLEQYEKDRPGIEQYVQKYIEPLLTGTGASSMQTTYKPNSPEVAQEIQNLINPSMKDGVQQGIKAITDPAQHPCMVYTDAVYPDENLPAGSVLPAAAERGVIPDLKQANPEDPYTYTYTIPSTNVQGTIRYRPQSEKNKEDAEAELLRLKSALKEAGIDVDNPSSLGVSNSDPHSPEAAGRRLARNLRILTRFMPQLEAVFSPRRLANAYARLAGILRNLGNQSDQNAFERGTRDLSGFMANPPVALQNNQSPSSPSTDSNDQGSSGTSNAIGTSNTGSSPNINMPSSPYHRNGNRNSILPNWSNRDDMNRDFQRALADGDLPRAQEIADYAGYDEGLIPPHAFEATYAPPSPYNGAIDPTAASTGVIDPVPVADAGKHPKLKNDPPSTASTAIRMTNGVRMGLPLHLFKVAPTMPDGEAIPQNGDTIYPNRISAVQAAQDTGGVAVPVRVLPEHIYIDGKSPNRFGYHDGSNTIDKTPRTRHKDMPAPMTPETAPDPSTNLIDYIRNPQQDQPAPTVLHQMIGPKAKLTPEQKEQLQKAKQMQKEKANPQQIKEETGWERDPSTRSWGQEVQPGEVRKTPFRQAIRRGEGKPAQLNSDDRDYAGITDPDKGILARVPLSQIWDAPDLYRAYPDMADIPVTLVPKKAYTDNSGGFYLPRTPTRPHGAIYMPMPFDSPSELRNWDTNGPTPAHKNKRNRFWNNRVGPTLDHEIQHGIQDREGWPKGGAAPNNYIYVKGPAAKQLLQTERDQVKRDIKNLKDNTPPNSQTPQMSPALHKVVRDALNDKNVEPQVERLTPSDQQRWEKELSPRVDELKNRDADLGYYLNGPGSAGQPYMIRLTPGQYYMLLGGEAQARNSEGRRNLTPEQRQKSLHADTQDVPQALLIGRNNAPRNFSYTTPDKRPADEVIPITFIPDELQQYPATQQSSPDGKPSYSPQKQPSQSRNVAYLPNEDGSTSPLIVNQDGTVEDPDQGEILGTSFLYPETRKPDGTLSAPARAFIAVGPRSDPSTFIHEAGHHSLEHFKERAREGNLKGQDKKDWDTLGRELDFAGIDFNKPLNDRDKGRWQDAHEKWAKAIEQYLYEGTAPSSPLRKVLRRFCKWMRGVYGDLKSDPYTYVDHNGVPQHWEAPDAVKEVIGRILANGMSRMEAEKALGYRPDPDTTHRGARSQQSRTHASSPAPTATPTQATATPRPSTSKTAERAAPRPNTQYSNYHQSPAYGSLFTPEARQQMAEIRKKYEGTPQWMKAKDGTPTLYPNEDIWLLVRTPNFKRWFGDWENDPNHASKVVSPNGEPQIVWHGTPVHGIKIFRKAGRGWLGPGVSFTPYRQYATDYMRDQPGELIGTFINLKNPLVVKTGDPMMELLEHFYDGDKAKAQRAYQQRKEKAIARAKAEIAKLKADAEREGRVLSDIDLDPERMANRYIISDADRQKILTKGGHDGIAWHCDEDIDDIKSRPGYDGFDDYITEYSVPDSSHVKSAFGNDGTFADAVGFNEKGEPVNSQGQPVTIYNQEADKPTASGTPVRPVSNPYRVLKSSNTAFAPDLRARLLQVENNPQARRQLEDAILEALATYQPHDWDQATRDAYNQAIANRLKPTREKYEGTPQWRKAQDGADSNLPESTWLQVRTPEFKDWGGDWESDPQNSEVCLDEHGEPIILWRGSKKTTRSPRFHRGDDTRAIFTSDRPWVGLTYISSLGSIDSLAPVLGKMRKPLIYDTQKAEWDDLFKGAPTIDLNRSRNYRRRANFGMPVDKPIHYVDASGKPFTSPATAQRYAVSQLGLTPQEAAEVINPAKVTTDDLFRNMVKGQLGGAWSGDHDGVILRQINDASVEQDNNGQPAYATNYMFTSPDQLKAALHNTGEFAQPTPANPEPSMFNQTATRSKTPKTAKKQSTPEHPTVADMQKAIPMTPEQKEGIKNLKKALDAGDYRDTGLEEPIRNLINNKPAKLKKSLQDQGLEGDPMWDYISDNLKDLFKGIPKKLWSTAMHLADIPDKAPVFTPDMVQEQARRFGDINDAVQDYPELQPLLDAKLDEYITGDGEPFRKAYDALTKGEPKRSPIEKMLNPSPGEKKQQIYDGYIQAPLNGLTQELPISHPAYLRDALQYAKDHPADPLAILNSQNQTFLPDLRRRLLREEQSAPDRKQLVDRLLDVLATEQPQEWTPEQRVAFRQLVNDKVQPIRDIYKGTPQWRKAPDGVASNLPETPWLQVRTPEFKDWGGDWETNPNARVCKDEHGEPIVLWHGTTAGWRDRFDRFGGNRDYNPMTDAIFTSDRPWVGLTYAGDSPVNGLIPVFGYMERPIVFDTGDAHWTDLLKRAPSIDLRKSKQYADRTNNGQRPDKECLYYTDENGEKFTSPEAAQQWAQDHLGLTPQEAQQVVVPHTDLATDGLYQDMMAGRLGGAWGGDRDGIILKNVDDASMEQDNKGKRAYGTNYMFRSPDQLKSALHNSGEFSQPSPDNPEPSLYNQTASKKSSPVSKTSKPLTADACIKKLSPNQLSQLKNISDTLSKVPYSNSKVVEDYIKDGTLPSAKTQAHPAWKKWQNVIDSAFAGVPQDLRHEVLQKVAPYTLQAPVKPQPPLTRNDVSLPFTPATSAIRPVMSSKAPADPQNPLADIVTAPHLQRVLGLTDKDLDEILPYAQLKAGQGLSGRPDLKPYADAIHHYLNGNESKALEALNNNGVKPNEWRVVKSAIDNGALKKLSDEDWDLAMDLARLRHAQQKKHQPPVTRSSFTPAQREAYGPWATGIAEAVTKVPELRPLLNAFLYSNVTGDPQPYRHAETVAKSDPYLNNYSHPYSGDLINGFISNLRGLQGKIGDISQTVPPIPPHQLGEFIQQAVTDPLAIDPNRIMMTETPGITSPDLRRRLVNAPQDSPEKKALTMDLLTTLRNSQPANQTQAERDAYLQAVEDALKPTRDSLKQDPDNYMKAPNGKPTNLPEWAWLQAKTPQFKAKNGDWENDPNAPVIKDENGEPLLLWHGNKYGDRGRIDRFVAPQDAAIFTSDQPWVGLTYTGPYANVDQLIPVFGYMKRPLKIDGNYCHWGNVLDSHPYLEIPQSKVPGNDGNIICTDENGNLFNSPQDAARWASQHYGLKPKEAAAAVRSGELTTDDLFQMMCQKKLGGHWGGDHDGMIIRNIDDADVESDTLGQAKYATNYMFTSPDQLSSAILNNGQFSSPSANNPEPSLYNQVASRPSQTQQSSYVPTPIEEIDGDLFFQDALSESRPNEQNTGASSNPAPAIFHQTSTKKTKASSEQKPKTTSSNKKSTTPATVAKQAIGKMSPKQVDNVKQIGTLLQKESNSANPALMQMLSAYLNGDADTLQGLTDNAGSRTQQRWGQVKAYIDKTMENVPQQAWPEVIKQVTGFDVAESAPEPAKQQVVQTQTASVAPKSSKTAKSASSASSAPATASTATSSSSSKSTKGSTAKTTSKATSKPAKAPSKREVEKFTDNLSEEQIEDIEDIMAESYEELNPKLNKLTWAYLKGTDSLEYAEAVSQVSPKEAKEWSQHIKPSLDKAFSDVPDNMKYAVGAMLSAYEPPDSQSQAEEAPAQETTDNSWAGKLPAPTAKHLSTLSKTQTAPYGTPDEHDGVVTIRGTEVDAKAIQAQRGTSSHYDSPADSYSIMQMFQRLGIPCSMAYASKLKDIIGDFSSVLYNRMRVIYKKLISLGGDLSKLTSSEKETLKQIQMLNEYLRIAPSYRDPGNQTLYRGCPGHQIKNPDSYTHELMQLKPGDPFINPYASSYTSDLNVARNTFGKGGGPVLVIENSDELDAASSIKNLSDSSDEDEVLVGDNKFVVTDVYDGDDGHRYIHIRKDPR